MSGQDVNCSVCGGPLSSRNRAIGICRSNNACKRAHRAAYDSTQTRKDARKDQQAKYYLANKDEAKARAKKYRQANPAKRREYAALWTRQNVKQRAWWHARRRAETAGLPFTITPDSLPDVPSACPVLGIPLDVGTGQRHAGSPSLDRIIPRLGYTPENVHWISWRANRIKNDATIDELRLVADYFERLVNG